MQYRNAVSRQRRAPARDPVQFSEAGVALIPYRLAASDTAVQRLVAFAFYLAGRDFRFRADDLGEAVEVSVACCGGQKILGRQADET